jgi:thiol-disulfide isomerase/thioredoxin
MAAVLLLSACSQAPAPAAAPPLTLPGLSGKPVSLSDFAGKVVLLDFWATWCEPCQEELPDLLRLQESYGNRGLVILGVSMDAGSKKVVEGYVRKNGVSYPILLADGRPVEGYRVIGLPTAFLIDSSGRIVKRYLGPKSFKEVSVDLESLLGQRFNQ